MVAPFSARLTPINFALHYTARGSLSQGCQLLDLPPMPTAFEERVGADSVHAAGSGLVPDFGVKFLLIFTLSSRSEATTLGQWDELLERFILTVPRRAAIVASFLQFISNETRIWTRNTLGLHVK